MANSRNPKKGFIFFLYDPQDGLSFFDDILERDRYAAECIAGYLDDDTGWYDDVEGVCVGIVTQVATQVDREDRPQDPEQAEEDGWPDDCTYRCNYKLL
jgi:hypothetical protein